MLAVLRVCVGGVSARCRRLFFLWGFVLKSRGGRDKKKVKGSAEGVGVAGGRGEVSTKSSSKSKEGAGRERERQRQRQELSSMSQGEAWPGIDIKARVGAAGGPQGQTADARSGEEARVCDAGAAAQVSVHVRGGGKAAAVEPGNAQALRKLVADGRAGSPDCDPT